MTETRTFYIAKYKCNISNVPVRIMPYWDLAGTPDHKPDEITECDAEVTDWLQHCFELLNTGQESKLRPDPFYVRPEGKPSLTRADIDKVIQGMDQEYEIENVGGFSMHRRASGAEKHTEFSRLGDQGRRALVEGAEKILTKWDGFYQQRIREMQLDGTFTVCNKYTSVVFARDYDDSWD